MSTNFRSLTANARNLGEIFYSGSISVKKGEEISFPLSEWFSFRVTEDCKVSMNASPFVGVAEGDSFIIYKRSEGDIASKNRKGIYIFDIDLVLSMAYPQELTQDIIIENDVFSNNYNTVTVEADKTPTAHIVLNNLEPTIGQIITIDGRSSYAVSPAAISNYAWIINGEHQPNSSYFSYRTKTVGVLDITLVVTDSEGRKANTRITAPVRALPPVVPPPITGGGGDTTPPPPTTPPPTTPPPPTPPKAISENVGIRVNEKVVSTSYATFARGITAKEIHSATINVSGSFTVSSSMSTRDHQFNPNKYYVDITIDGVSLMVIEGVYPSITYWDTFNFDGYRTIPDIYVKRGAVIDVAITAVANKSASADYSGRVKSGSVNVIIQGYDKPI